jgi:acid stress-induced BolA-like protein IbaG/YrbA
MATTRLTKQKLEDVLSRGLCLKDPEFHLEKAGNRILGDIISPSFKGKRDHERQQLIWDVLKAEFGMESVRLVGILLAFTPDEWNLGMDSESVPSKNKKRAG